MSMHPQSVPHPSATGAPVSCFSVVAASEPGVMPRVVQVFAKRGLVPTRWYSTLSGPCGEDLHIDIQVVGLDAGLRSRIAESLRQMVSIETVLTSERQMALSA